MFDDGSGYDLGDPKHPSYYERHADAADHARKRARENPVLPPPAMQEPDESAPEPGKPALD